jgi:hypothetical protein
MLRFLSLLFSEATAGADADAPDPAVIEAAIERAVDGTDRRLRAVGDYRKRLRDPVERAVRHVMTLVDSLPEPAEISQQSFGTDPRVRAFFSSGEHLREVLGGIAGLRACLEQCAGPVPDDLFGMLTMAMEERNVLGMELDGDIVRRDVLQVSVSFSRHRYLCPAAREADARWELKKRAFDFLVERALERLAEAKQKRGELERQRLLLRRKLDAMKAGNWGLDSMFADGDESPPDLAALEADIEAVDAELGNSGSQALGLEESLEHVADTLGHPEDWLAAREICLQLDYRGIKATRPCTNSLPELRLTELYSGSGQRRIALFGRVPHGEIPERPDFLREASRYLG